MDCLVMPIPLLESKCLKVIKKKIHTIKEENVKKMATDWYKRRGRKSLEKK